MRGQTFARRRLLLGVGFTALMLVGATPSLAEDLTFVWHAGTCADLVYQISKDYPDKSINIVPDLVPYGPLWHDKIAANFAIHGDAFDFAMWDSQSDRGIRGRRACLFSEQSFPGFALP